MRQVVTRVVRFVAAIHRARNAVVAINRRTVLAGPIHAGLVPVAIQAVGAVRVG